MNLLSFEYKKTFRSVGFRYLCIFLLLLNFLFCLFGNINSPDVSEQEEHIKNYDSNIAYVIRVAELNFREYEATMGIDNYLVQYQQEVIDHYSILVENEVKPTLVSGWNEFFDNKTDDLILILFAVLAGVVITITEYDNNTHTTLNMTIKGRKSIRAKIVLMSCLALVSVIFLILINIAGIAIRFGLSSPTAPVCSVIRFAYCPYDISILHYLILSAIIKVLNMLCVMLLFGMIAALFKSYLVPFSLSLGYIAIGYVISTIQTNSALIFFNPYSIGITDTLFERYRSLNIFGQAVPILPIIIVSLTLICFLFATLFYFALSYQSNQSVFSKVEKNFLIAYHKYSEKILSRIPRSKPHRQRLLLTEAKKSFIKSRLIFLCIIMLFVKIWYVQTTVPQVDIAEQYYRDICYSISGELTFEKRQHIWDKIDESNLVISQKDYMSNAVKDGTITNEEYNDYFEKYNLANLDKFAYQKLLQQCNRIDIATERGQTAYITYDSGWLYLFSQNSDVILYAFLLLFFCGIYDMEYKNGFHRIAETTAKGMSALHKSKTIIAITVALLSFVLFSIIDLIYTLQTFSFPNADFSISAILVSPFSIPIWCAATFKYIIGISLAVGFSVLVCLISRFLKKIYLVIPTGVLLTILLISIF